MQDTQNILICGVGGQGTLLASRVLGEYAARTGMDCKLSEVHGMAQRGGSVVTHVKIGKNIFSPLIEAGSADIILAFEELEALRMAHFLKPDGKMLLNTQRINPLPVITGAAQYPDGIAETLKKRGITLYAIDALNLSIKAGNVKTVNTVMLGALVKIMSLDYNVMEQSLTTLLPEKVKESNIFALKTGNCAIL